METKGSQSFPKPLIYCFLNHSPERIQNFIYLAMSRVMLRGEICLNSGSVKQTVSNRIFSSTRFLTYQEKRYQVEK